MPEEITAQVQSQIQTSPPAGETGEESSLKTEKKETLLSWRSSSRPFKKRKREYYATLIIIVLLISGILFFFGQFALILAVWALSFMAISFSIVPPHDTDYKITTQGIVVGEHAYLWNELYDFYFKKQFGSEVIEVRGHTALPFLLVLTLGSVPKEQVKEVLNKYLPFREVIERNFMDKAGDWLARTFPLEKN